MSTIGFSSSASTQATDYHALFSSVTSKTSDNVEEKEDVENSEDVEDTETEDSENSESSDKLEGYWDTGSVDLSLLGNSFSHLAMNGVTTDSTSASDFIMTNDYLNVFVQAAANDLGKSNITFSDLMAHRNYLTDVFAATVKVGLKEAGVSEDADFRINLDENGNIAVHSNHEDKAKIEKFFADNPELAGSFQYIEALNQIEQTRNNRSYDLKSIYSQGRQLSSSSLNYGYTATGSATNNNTSSPIFSNSMAMTASATDPSFIPFTGINTTA